MQNKQFENDHNPGPDEWLVCDECGLEVPSYFAYIYPTGKVKCIPCSGICINLIRSKIPT